MADNVIYHTIEHWDTPRGGMFNIYTDAWWCVDDDGNPLFYGKGNSPQCNSNKDIIDTLARGSRVRKIPVVYVPLRIQDYVS